MNKRFNLVHEKDAKTLVILWKETYRTEASSLLNLLTRNIEDARANKGFQDISAKAFRSIYQYFGIYTKKIPDFLKNVDSFKTWEEYTLTEETLNELHEVTKEALEWKKKFRSLKKEYEFEVLMYNANHCHYREVDITKIMQF